MADTWKQVTSLITHTVAPDNQQPLRAAIRSAKAADHARIAALEHEAQKYRDLYVLICATFDQPVHYPGIMSPLALVQQCKDERDQARAQLTALEEAHVRLQVEKREPAYLSRDYARMWDLARYARGYLLENELVTLQEYTALVSEETMLKPGQGSPAPRRLESYDELRQQLSTLSASSVRLRDALEAIVDDLEARWDMSDQRTNPGIRDNVANARKALVAASQETT